MGENKKAAYGRTYDNVPQYPQKGQKWRKCILLTFQTSRNNIAQFNTVFDDCLVFLGLITRLIYFCQILGFRNLDVRFDPL